LPKIKQRLIDVAVAFSINQQLRTVRFGSSQGSREMAASLVSGHDFSRAEDLLKGIGFSRCTVHAEAKAELKNEHCGTTEVVP
jgi:hypothetical protein